ncbi:MAG TPA: glycoside hydrolase family 38 C-terminal domain-containing protein [Bacteroidota bacterium]
MKPHYPFVALLLIAGSAHPQSNVDRLVEELDFLSNGSLNNWKYSTDFSGDPIMAGFDDSAWTTLSLNQSIYPDSCWIWKEIELPARILGEPLRGPVRFLVSVDDYGYLWVNGESKGHFPWDGEFLLTNDARAGQKFLIVIKAINTGGPLRLIRAQIQSDSSSDLREMIEDFSLSLRVGQKLLSFDTYQTNARRKEDPSIDKSLFDRGEKQELNDLLQSVAPTIEVDELKRGNIAAFKSSMESARTRLKPVGEFARRFTLFFTSNAHIDAAWLWRKVETIDVCRNTFSSVMNMMNARPDFTYTQSAAAYYDWMERFAPPLFEQIKSRINEGRWEVTGGMWVEPDCNLPGGESWARHLLYAKRYFRKKFGVDVRIGWNPDSFGYNWNMPQFYKNAGIDAFITQKIGWNDTNVFPHRVFWWEAPDGSRILSYFPFDYVNTIENPFQLIDWLRQFEANTGLTRMLMLFGIGNHGGGPSLEMLARIDKLKSLDIFPNIVHGTSATYLEWLKSQNHSSVPVWKDELYLEYHRGTYTTQARMKERNKMSEALLTNAEKFSAIASLYGRPYNGSDLEVAWRKALFNQFHDILPGSGIREVYIDANEDYNETQAIGEFELNGALQSITGKVNTATIKNGIPIVLFNPLAWERTEIVKVKLPKGDAGEYTVFDLNGIEVPSQTVSSDRYDREVFFMASGIPSLGYSTCVLRKTKPSPTPSALKVTGSSLENEYFAVSIDPETGWVKSILDKRKGSEVLAGYGNELQLLEDRPSAWDAWNIGLTGRKYPSRFRGTEVVEAGPVRVVLRMRRDYLKPGVQKDFPTEDFPSTFLTQDIVLGAGVDRIDFRTEVDWWEDKTMLKAAFPLSVSDTIATFDIPYGTIRRSTRTHTSKEKAQFEVSAQRWADVSQRDYGVSLLTKTKYGVDIKGNIMRLSLLRSPLWPDPTADRGKHEIEYALYPHAGSWRDAGTTRKALEFNRPLIAVVTTEHKGTLPPSGSFVAIIPSNVILTSIKKAEEGSAWVVQYYEAEGISTEATLTLPSEVKKAVTSNFLEEEGEPVPFQGREVKLRTRANSVVTVKVWF